ncbi:MAG: hypothetical protein K2W92_09800 [Alphaproteobacteria bacterium]|nr:hypothetical protein [Alphaproteobacteria bacterium]
MLIVMEGIQKEEMARNHLIEYEGTSTPQDAIVRRLIRRESVLEGTGKSVSMTLKTVLLKNESIAEEGILDQKGLLRQIQHLNAMYVQENRPFKGEERKGTLFREEELLKPDLAEITIR